jgi:hypothetical protein
LDQSLTKKNVSTVWWICLFASITALIQNSVIGYMIVFSHELSNVPVIIVYIIIPLFLPIVLAFFLGWDIGNIIFSILILGSLIGGISFVLINTLGIINFDFLYYDVSQVIITSMQRFIIVFLLLPSLGTLPFVISMGYHKTKFEKENKGLNLLKKAQKKPGIVGLRMLSEAVKAELCLKNRKNLKKIVLNYTERAKEIICFDLMKTNLEEFNAIEVLHNTLESSKDDWQDNPKIYEELGKIKEMLRSAREGNFKTIYIECTHIPEINEQMIGILEESGKVILKDLAEKLGYSKLSVLGLLNENLVAGRIEGFLDKDTESFITKDYLENVLTKTFGKTSL